jgi:RNA polymerase sigma-70 factor (ECF subfamily)
MADAQTRTSTTLLGRVALTGDEPACAEFVARYEPMVRAIARSRGLTPEECEDVTQEVMMAAISALREHRYDRQVGRFKTWLKGVIYHKVSHARQARARHTPGDVRVSPGVPAVPVRAGAPLESIPDPHPTPDEQFEAEFEAQWQKVAFEEALDEVRREVDPLTYQAFDLYARKNRPPREVAKLLGISRNAIYIAKSRILSRLREKLGKPEE